MVSNGHLLLILLSSLHNYDTTLFFFVFTFFSINFFIIEVSWRELFSIHTDKIKFPNTCCREPIPQYWMIKFVPGDLLYNQSGVLMSSFLYFLLNTSHFLKWSLTRSIFGVFILTPQWSHLMDFKFDVFSPLLNNAHASSGVRTTWLSLAGTGSWIGSVYGVVGIHCLKYWNLFFEGFR